MNTQKGKWGWRSTRGRRRKIERKKAEELGEGESEKEEEVNVQGFIDNTKKIWQHW
jgi:hypothetical protein